MRLVLSYYLHTGNSDACSTVLAPSWLYQDDMTEQKLGGVCPRVTLVEEAVENHLGQLGNPMAAIPTRHAALQVGRVLDKPEYDTDKSSCEHMYCTLNRVLRLRRATGIEWHEACSCGSLARISDIPLHKESFLRCFQSNEPESSPVVLCRDVCNETSARQQTDGSPTPAPSLRPCLKSPTNRKRKCCGKPARQGLGFRIRVWQALRP